jgi:molybdopterin converting factor small subunit
MNITIFLHTTLQRQASNSTMGKLAIDLPLGSTLASLIKLLEIKLDVENTLLVVNGHTAELSQVLSDGDQVHLIPAISGG